MRFAVMLVLAALAGSGLQNAPAGLADHGLAAVPLNDLGAGTYLGVYEGGLYESGTNVVPPDHAAVGAARAAAVQPLDVFGAPSGQGRIVLLSVGMSNTTQEFCSASSALPCDSWTFMGQSAVDAGVNHTSLSIVNGAAGGQAAATWDQASDPNYDRVRDTRLAPQGLTEAQVQAVWVKVANPGPTASLPNTLADAYVLESRSGGIMRALRTRYPNVQLVFLSSRIYAGYATTLLNPEPYAYESAFSAKWLIQAQIDQMRNGGVIVDPLAGDLNYNTVAPWVSWGPYLWADGLIPRSDGLIWEQGDLDPGDGTHPAQTGEEKVGTMLRDFFKTSAYSVCWFLVDVDGDGVSDPCDSGDFDGDSLSDQAEYYCGSPADDVNLRPERVDGVFAGVDDDGDTAVDEGLPAAAAALDCDADGFTGTAEDHVYSYFPQAGGDQKTCQEFDGAFPNSNPAMTPSLRWPMDLMAGPFSENRVNVADMASYIAPVRYFGEDVGTYPADVRLDIVPGTTFGTDINIQDMAAMIGGEAAYPPMFFGLRAFGGPQCPWAP